MLLFKVPILFNPRTGNRKYIIAERRYRCHKEIIPLGCDCHPAYALQSLNIRKQSLPFDWLNTDPVKGLAYVVDNIENKFQYFLADLERNEDGHIVSARYSYAEFMHEKSLIENEADKQKFSRRIKRFQELIHQDAIFIYNITSESLKSAAEVRKFYDSVTRFERLMSAGQILSIYIRHDESLEDNRVFCDELIEKVKEINKVSIASYITEKEKFGLWGNKKAYPRLFNLLGIDLHYSFPKVYVK